MATSANFLVLHPGTRKEFHVELLTLKKADIIIRAINHKLRLQIIRLLHDKEELTVTEIYVKLRLEQSVASQHLALLRRAGIVNTRREGKYIYYSVDSGRIEDIYKLAKQITLTK
jgi:DNA-binding transcriptional ArsR family regulator